jgi:hypothetical protein
MKRSFVCVLSVLALALTAPLMAQSEQSASGTVVSSSSNQLVIRTADGSQMTFMIDQDTNQPSSLSQGSPVTVRYHDMNGTFHAANVSASSSGSNSGGSMTGNTSSSTTGTSSARTGSSTSSTTGSTATGTSTTSANAQDRGTTPDPTGNDARNTRTTAEDVTGTAGTRDSGTATGTNTDQTGNLNNNTATTGSSSNRNNMGNRATAQQDTTGQTGTTDRTGTTGATDTTGASGTTRSSRLPGTASPLPLMGLSGLFALASGLGVRGFRRRK